MHIPPLSNDPELVDISEIGEQTFKETQEIMIDLSYNRECDGCTKCCEGWLGSTLYGKSMYKGRKCHYVKQGVGCAIYENRPADPCKGFQCAWKVDLSIPEWFKPDKSNVICMWKTVREEDPIYYLHIVECDTPLDSRVLSWLIENQTNYAYMLYGETHYVGSPEFIKIINGQK